VPHPTRSEPGSPDSVDVHHLQSTRRLRVAVIAHNRFPIRQPFAGGLESHVWYLVRALAARGHDVSLFAAPGSDLDIKVEPFDVDIRRIGEKCRPQWKAPIPDHRDYRTLMESLIGDAGESFDLVHNHAYHYWPILLASRLKVPMLTTLHTSPVLWLESAIRFSGGRGSRFASVSQYAAQQWHGVIEDVLVVDNGVRVADWPPGSGGPYLVWSGRITPEKGPHAAIEAARRGGMPLVLAGRIHHQRYFRHAIRPHLGRDVTYVGHLAQPQLAQLIGGAAAALVTPYMDEAYGLVVAEAMSCGTPVIAFGRGAIPSLVTPNVGRVVAPGDVAAMAAAIAEIPQFSRTDVRNHAETHASEDTTVDRYVDIYGSLIEQGLERRSELSRPPVSADRDRTPSMSRFATTLCQTAVADGAQKISHTLAKIGHSHRRGLVPSPDRGPSSQR
jgi:glycosyltransferase involved in cell wall biosynthesis